jgi:hypothetical protein
MSNLEERIKKLEEELEELKNETNKNVISRGILINSIYNGKTKQLDSLENDLKNVLRCISILRNTIAMHDATLNYDICNERKNILNEIISKYNELCDFLIKEDNIRKKLTNEYKKFHKYVRNKYGITVLGLEFNKIDYTQYVKAECVFENKILKITCENIEEVNIVGNPFLNNKSEAIQKNVPEITVINDTLYYVYKKPKLVNVEKTPIGSCKYNVILEFEFDKVISTMFDK